MTNREILAELKKSWEYLNDITENGNQEHCGGQLPKYIIDRIEKAKTELEYAYYDVYRELDKSEVEINYWKDGVPYYCGYICEDISGDYMTYDEEGTGEVIYNTCGDLDYCWYDDEDYLTNY